MNENCNVELAERNGNYHLDIIGEFDNDSAAGLTSILEKSYSGSGNIFISTGNVTNIADDSEKYLASLFTKSELPTSKIYFKGKHAFALCHNLGKVIERSTRPMPTSCGGCCKKCSCS